MLKYSAETRGYTGSLWFCQYKQDAFTPHIASKKFLEKYLIYETFVTSAIKRLDTI